MGFLIFVFELPSRCASQPLISGGRMRGPFLHGPIFVRLTMLMFVIDNHAARFMLLLWMKQRSNNHETAMKPQAYFRCFLGYRFSSRIFIKTKAMLMKNLRSKAKALLCLMPLCLLFLTSLAQAHPGHDHSHWTSTAIHALSILAVFAVGAVVLWRVKMAEKIEGKMAERVVEKSGRE